MRGGSWVNIALGIALGGAAAVALYLVAKQQFPQLGLPGQIPQNVTGR